MSSTSNSQNLLVNVFRPAYVYSSTTGFVPKLALSNVDVLAATSLQVSSFQLSDPAGNIYIGSNVGGPTNVSNSNIVAIGVGAASNCSNTQGTIAIGLNSFANMSNSSNSVGIGANTSGGGISNVVLGANSGTAGQNMIVLGCGLTPASSVSNRMYVGSGSMSNITLTGDLSNRRLGINTTTPQATLDVSGDVYVRDWVGVGVDVPQAAVHVNGSVYATTGFAGQNGGQGAPTYSFLSDPSAGIYRTATGGLGLASGGIVSNVGAGGTSTIGTLSVGMISINVQEETAVGSNYASLIVYASDAAGGTAPVNVSSNVQNGVANITFSGSNIQISNSGAGTSNFKYSLTYFPLP